MLERSFTTCHSFVSNRQQTGRVESGDTMCLLYEKQLYPWRTHRVNLGSSFCIYLILFNFFLFFLLLFIDFFIENVLKRDQINFKSPDDNCFKYDANAIQAEKHF